MGGEIDRLILQPLVINAKTISEAWFLVLYEIAKKLLLLHTTNSKRFI